MRTRGPALAPARRQRGAAVLVVTMLLFFAMVLAILYANRTLLDGQRSALAQARTAQAFEAAEAGLEWGLAQLNADRPIDAACRAVADPGSGSFRTRYLPAAPLTTPGPAPGCTRLDAGWSCRCPSASAGAAAPPRADAAGAAFAVSFTPAEPPAAVRLTAIGCAGATACTPGTTGQGAATARIEVALGLLPALRHPPLAPITVRGEFQAGNAPLEVHNTDPASAIGIRAGSRIDAAGLRLTPPTGSATAGMLAGHDVALAALSPDQLFVATFGLDKTRWRDQPSVTRLRCPAACAGALAAAVANSADAALVWIDGDLSLQGPVALGTAQHPVAIVVSGAARLDGAVAITGALYAARLSWNGTDGSGAVLRGAAVSEADYRGDGAPQFVYDPQVLDLLARRAGTYARISGSWREL